MSLQYSIRRSKRARRIILRVNHAGAVEVVVPWYVAKRHGEKFLHQRQAWVAKVQARMVGRSRVPVKRLDERQARAQAQEYFEEITGEMAQQLGVGRPRIKISDFRSQWGSCNRRTNTLKFSWRLMLASEPIARYVAAHETAHLAQANHSQNFWRLVAQLDPKYKQARRWLRQHGLVLRT